MRYYDREENRLIYLEQPSTPEFWDRHWDLSTGIREKLLAKKWTFVTRMTEQFLQPEQGPILEGGCGWGQHIAALANRGYRCIGVDSAPQTVEVLNRAVPELDIRLGDVRRLPFDDRFFSGYWSLGVIEHFWEGYADIGREAARVVRPGGYLFLTIPYLSPLRKLKIRLDRYPVWHGGDVPASFYQFVLDHHGVIDRFQRWGFRLVREKPMDGFKGLKSESRVLQPVLQRLYDRQERSLLARGLGAALYRGLAPVAGHTILLVFRRTDEKPSR